MKNMPKMTVVAIAVLIASPTAFSQKTNLPDLDRDGIPNIFDRDLDNDGILNGSDRNIDGGVAKSGPLRGRYIGDRLPNDSSQELDMDADGLADIAVAETDIDGDGIANGLDGDVDGDGLANNADPDMHGTGVLNDILANADSLYAPDASVISTINYVGGEIRRLFQIPATDKGLVVKVSANQFGSLVTGLWRYLSQDNIQVYAKWCYPADDPSDLNIAVIYRYDGPYSGNPTDYTNPAYYYISDESRIYSQYPGGGITFVSWVPQQPAGFYFGAVFQTYTSMPTSLASGGFYYGTASGEPSEFTPPYQTLVNALSAYPNLTSDPQYLSFSGNLGTAPGLPSLQPLIELQRTVMRVSRAWYGQQEARQIR